MWFTQLTGIIATESDLLSTDVQYLWIDSCVDSNPCLALIDTGTSYITMPSAIYYKLIDYLVDYTSNTVHCIKYNSDFMCSTDKYTSDDLPTLWFQIGGYGFKLSPNQYMLTGSDSCAIGYDCMAISFLDSMGEHTYILGDTFLREYYLVFDETNYRIGLGAMNDDLVSEAIPRPPINAFWSYIQIGSYIIGIFGVCVCLIASFWKLKKPSSAWMRNARQEINEYNNIDDDHLNVTQQSHQDMNCDLRIDDDDEIVFDKDYNSKIREHRKAFLDLNENVLTTRSDRNNGENTYQEF